MKGIKTIGYLGSLFFIFLALLALGQFVIATPSVSIPENATITNQTVDGMYITANGDYAVGYYNFTDFNSTVNIDLYYLSQSNSTGASTTTPVFVKNLAVNESMTNNSDHNMSYNLTFYINASDLTSGDGYYYTYGYGNITGGAQTTSSANISFIVHSVTSTRWTVFAPMEEDNTSISSYSDFLTLPENGTQFRGVRFQDWVANRTNIQYLSVYNISKAWTTYAFAAKDSGAANENATINWSNDVIFVKTFSGKTSKIIRHNFSSSMIPTPLAYNLTTNTNVWSLVGLYCENMTQDLMGINGSKITLISYYNNTDGLFYTLKAGWDMNNVSVRKGDAVWINHPVGTDINYTSWTRSLC